MGAGSGTARYAVLFRTHFWDEYAERQYRRLAARCADGDVFIVVDETNGRVAIPHGNVVPHTQDGVLGLGLGRGGHGNLLWFNGDYPLYAFFREHGRYDYYVMSEYDVVVQRDVGEIVAQAQREEIDFVGLTKGEAVADWPFTASCLDAYEAEQVRKRLICFAVFSHRAVDRLFRKRLELSRQLREGTLRRWPYCEAFIPTELGVAGYRMAELSEFGPTGRYDWTPALAETDLPLLGREAFLHPVLDPSRYIQHTLKAVWPPEAFFLPGSEVSRRIRRVPARVYGPALLRALGKRARGFVAARAARLARTGPAQARTGHG